MGLPPGGKRGVMEQGGQIGVVCSELNLESCFPLRACFLLIRWECRDLSTTTTTTTCTHMRSLVSKGMARVADPAQGCFSSVHQCNFTIIQNLFPLVPTERPYVFIGQAPRISHWGTSARCMSSQHLSPQMTSFSLICSSHPSLFTAPWPLRLGLATEPLYCQLFHLDALPSCSSPGSP